jgi:multimeric flavodoxin WrbA
MPELLAKIESADLIIYASPLYYFSVTSKLKSVIERRLPLGLPFLITKNGLTVHPKKNQKCQKWIIISTCAFSEYDNFCSLDMFYEQNAYATGSEIIGKIYWTQSEALLSNPELFTKYLKTCERAGEEIATQGKFSEKTKKVLSKEMKMPAFAYNFIGNVRWNTRRKAIK